MTVSYLPQPEAHAPSPKLTPATVVAMAGTTPIVSIGGEPRRATMALAFPYQPAVGDELLIIREDERCYVIGVLHAHGGVALRFMGDVSVRAVDGSIELAADKGVTLRGDEVSVLSKSLRLLTGNVVERAERWYRRVRGAFDLHVGEKRQLVDGAYEMRADKAATLTRGIVTINGKEVHLG